ncbi:PspC domain-containing protein [Pedobacter glucosidilyticus]|uniref:PspC domain-containing protein n=1 Tax=Pedobacter glucosidilyticus TaxID=1122941 RepID=UPI000409FDC4|nr:PspC family transcriptional regulator [Pedobacter glucosidilyticus]
MFQRMITFFERHSFGVCTYLGERFHISIAKIRLFFIYSSFLAVGFPIIFYFLAAFTLDIRSYVRKIRLKYWDI